MSKKQDLKHGLHNLLPPKKALVSRVDVPQASLIKRSKTGDLLSDANTEPKPQPTPTKRKSAESLTSQPSLNEGESPNKKARRLPALKKPTSFSSISSKNSAKCSEWEQLLELCKQSSVLPFLEVYRPEEYDQHEFIDSGTYSIVFGAQDVARQKYIVFKAVRIMSRESSNKLYSLNAKGYETFQEIIPEVAVAIALSNLHGGITDEQNREFQCHNYPRVYMASVVFSEVPNFFLVHPWNVGKYRHKTLKPVERFAANPALPNLYLILKMKHAGESLWSLMNKRSGPESLTAQQLESLLVQMIFALAVGEGAYEFEHRDLHICNVLVKRTKKKYIKFKLASVEYAVFSHGVKLVVIDNTFSRMRFRGQTYYTDLGGRLGTIGEGEPPKEPQEFAYYLSYQACKNNWEDFAPQTNIYWLRYFAQELMNAPVMKETGNKRIRLHLLEISDMMLKCTTIAEIVKYPKLKKFRTSDKSPATSASDTPKSDDSRTSASRDSFTGLPKRQCESDSSLSSSSSDYRLSNPSSSSTSSSSSFLTTHNPPNGRKEDPKDNGDSQTSLQSQSSTGSFTEN